MVIVTIVEHPGLSQPQVDTFRRKCAAHGPSRPSGASCSLARQTEQPERGRGGSFPPQGDHALAAGLDAAFNAF